MSSTEAPAASERRGGRLLGIRARVRTWPGGRMIWRVLVTIVGVAVCAIGVVLLPLPGPGWLIIFAGLGILATEYAWAARLLARVRAFARRWTDWVKRQHLYVRIALLVLGVAVVVALVLAGWFIER